MDSGNLARDNPADSQHNDSHTERSKLARRKSGRVVASRYMASSERRGCSLNSTLSDTRPHDFRPPVHSTPMVTAAKSALAVSVGEEQSGPSMSTSVSSRRHDSGSSACTRRSDQKKSKIQEDRLTATLPEDVVAYNQYLQWAYMARKVAANSLSLKSALKKETVEMCEFAASQQKHLSELQRSVQAAELYCKLLKFEKQLSKTIELIKEQSSPAVAQLARLSNLLSLYKNLFSSKGCTPVTHEETLIDKLNSAMSQCCCELRSVHSFIGERGEELESSASALLSLSTQLKHGSDHVSRIIPSIDRLSSLSVLEASERFADLLEASEQSGAPV